MLLCLQSVFGSHHIFFIVYAKGVLASFSLVFVFQRDNLTLLALPADLVSRHKIPVFTQSMQQYIPHDKAHFKLGSLGRTLKLNIIFVLFLHNVYQAHGHGRLEGQLPLTKFVLCPPPPKKNI